MQREIALERRPQGSLDPSDFRVRTTSIPTPSDGEALVRVKLLSIDPYLRTLMDERPLVGQPLALGAVVPGRGIGEVVDSKSKHLQAGQLVIGEFGWREMVCMPVASLRVIHTTSHPLTWHLGVLGVPGATALLALELIAEPEPGQSILITSAGGTVGSAAAQIAKSLGCQTFGTASKAKVDTCERVLGFDRCIDRDSERELKVGLAPFLTELDILFDNVGGASLEAGLSILRPGGRAILCGRIAHYQHPLGDRSSDNLSELILLKRLRIEGFNVRNHLAQLDDAFRRLTLLADRGLLKQLDSVCVGLESAPSALQELLSGRHIGKVLVQV